MKFSIKFSTFLLLTTAPVIAEELIVLDEIIVTAGYTDSNINSTGASVSVLGQQELQYTNSGIVSAFESIPGVSMDTNGGLGGVAGISVRGLKQKYINVRIDGMDVTDPSQPQNSYDFGGLTGIGLGQVEFIKGSQSAVFGSEAVGGVINLKTLSSDQEGSRGVITSEAGSNETYSVGLTYESVGEEGSAAITLSRLQTEGFSAKKTGNGANENDPYSGNLIRVAIEQAINKNLKLNFSGLSSSEIIRFDQSDPLDDTTDRDTISMRLGLEFNLGSIFNELSISDGSFDRFNSDNGFGHLWWYSDRRDIEYKGSISFSNISLSFGASSSKETIKTGYETGNDTENAFFLGVNTNISEQMDISGTIRQTDSNDFGSNVSYRLAGIYNLQDKVKLRAMASTGFRAPSLYERYSSSGNTGFKPEESQTQELGLEKIYESGSSARVTLFNTEIKNLIEYVGAPTWAYAQLGNNYKATGVELEGNWNLNDLIVLSGSYSYTDAKQGNTTAVRVPRQDYSISIAANISPEISSSLTANHIRNYKDTVGDMPDYTVVNAAASYNFSQNWDGYIRVQNLMDTDYETVKDFNTGGRQIFAGIRATF